MSAQFRPANGQTFTKAEIIAAQRAGGFRQVGPNPVPAPAPAPVPLTIGDIASDFITPIADQQRVSAIQELPGHGVFWTYTRGPVDPATGTSIGSYSLTDTGKNVAVGGGLVVAALFLIGWLK